MFIRNLHANDVIDCISGLQVGEQTWSDGIFPNLIFQDPEPGESDNRGSFCLSISPPDPNKIKVNFGIKF